MWQAVHWVSDDPGGSDSGCAGGFSRDADPALEKPEGGGVYGTNTPNVIRVDGGYRMYYTLIGPTPDNPLGPSVATLFVSQRPAGRASQSVSQCLRDHCLADSLADGFVIHTRCQRLHVGHV